MDKQPPRGAPSPHKRFAGDRRGEGELLGWTPEERDNDRPDRRVSGDPQEHIKADAQRDAASLRVIPVEREPRVVGRRERDQVGHVLSFGCEAGSRTVRRFGDQASQGGRHARRRTGAAVLRPPPPCRRPRRLLRWVPSDPCQCSTPGWSGWWGGSRQAEENAVTCATQVLLACPPANPPGSGLCGPWPSRALSSTDRALASGARDRGSIPLGRTSRRRPAVPAAAGFVGPPDLVSGGPTCPKLSSPLNPAEKRPAWMARWDELRPRDRARRTARPPSGSGSSSSSSDPDARRPVPRRPPTGSRRRPGRQAPGGRAPVDARRALKDKGRDRELVRVLRPARARSGPDDGTLRTALHRGRRGARTPDRSDLEALLEKSGVAGGAGDRARRSRPTALERYLRLEPGRVRLPQDGLGRRARSPSTYPERGRCVIDFRTKPGHEMDIHAAADLLERLPDERHPRDGAWPTRRACATLAKAASRSRCCARRSRGSATTPRCAT